MKKLILALAFWLAPASALDTTVVLALPSFGNTHAQVNGWGYQGN